MSRELYDPCCGQRPVIRERDGRHIAECRQKCGETVEVKDRDLLCIAWNLRCRGINATEVNMRIEMDFNRALTMIEKGGNQ